MTFKTADLCDQFSDELQVLEPMFSNFGGNGTFHGPVVTLKVFEDNSLVRKALEAPGQGRVLVVDGGASMRCALVGDQLAELAVRNGWSGIVVNGCIRDSEAIASLDIGVQAIGTHPLKSVKRGEGQHDVELRFAGARIAPGSFLYADDDGIVVAARALG
ncbi:MAG: ribonuclease E activity regulator RraA [Pseudomonadota bacterium]|nr:ribonuclease E activity regulator RraA [Pseudomonadota bacterium]